MRRGLKAGLYPPAESDRAPALGRLFILLAALLLLTFPQRAKARFLLFFPDITDVREGAHSVQYCPNLVEITSCAYTIKGPGCYFVSSPLTSQSDADCIVITSHDVTLYLRGNSIAGSGNTSGTSSGIDVFSSTHVTIEGGSGTISGFGQGILIKKASNVRARNFSANGNGVGVSLDNAHDADILKFVANNNTLSGVQITIASDNTIANFEANDNSQNGLLIVGSRGDRITNFETDSNGSDGVVISDGDFCSGRCRPSFPPARNHTIEKGQADNNGQAGIDLNNWSQENRVTSNSAAGNGAADMVDIHPGCDHDIWADNTFTSANRHCIH